MKIPESQHLATVFVVVALSGLIVVIMLMRAPLDMQCASLEECVRNANIFGVYNAVYQDSFSSPGGTATVQKSYTVMNDQVVACGSCREIYMSGYGNSTVECAQGWNCINVLTQGDILSTVRSMSATETFRFGERQCFRGSVGDFNATVCFDQTNRIVNYHESGRRPAYSFSIEGYETYLS